MGCCKNISMALALLPNLTRAFHGRARGLSRRVEIQRLVGYRALSLKGQKLDDSSLLPEGLGRGSSTQPPAPSASLGPLLRPELHVGVSKLGFDFMTPIQAQALPHALAGRDCLGQARTGSGKTVVFGLAALQRLELGTKQQAADESRSPQALVQAVVVSPTRELAAQLVKEVRKLGAGMDGVRVVACVGGANSRDQKKALAAGAHIVVSPSKGE